MKSVGVWVKGLVFWQQNYYVIHLSSYSRGTLFLELSRWELSVSTLHVTAFLTKCQIPSTICNIILLSVIGYPEKYIAAQYFPLYLHFRKLPMKWEACDNMHACTSSPSLIAIWLTYTNIRSTFNLYQWLSRTIQSSNFSIRRYMV